MLETLVEPRAMPSPFVRTLRSLEHEKHRGLGWRLAGALVLLAGWVAWMTCARVAVYATSADGRIEVSDLSHRAAAQDAGRVTAVHVELGRAVREGDVLVELDDTVERKQREEAAAKVAALGPQIDAVRAQLDVQYDLALWQWKLDEASVRQALADLDQAQADSKYESELGSISRRLRDQQLASAVDDLNAQKAAMESRLKASSAKAGVSHAAANQRVERARALATVAELRRSLAELEAQRSTAAAAEATARATLERRTVRAPVSGKIAATAALQVGDVLKAGDVVATIVPSDGLHVVAQFAPADAVGRVSPGQHGRVRLAGFPVTQYGTLDATVQHVASEPLDGTVRVELVLDRAPGAGIPLQHGLPGSVDIEVERVPPWVLLLRGAGGIVEGGAAGPAPTAPAASATPAGGRP